MLAVRLDAAGETFFKADLGFEAQRVPPRRP
jgi:hypothetical protein